MTQLNRDAMGIGEGSGEPTEANEPEPVTEIPSPDVKESPEEA